MATMAQALEALYSDLEGILLALVPDSRPDVRFAVRQPQDEALRPLAESTGRARLFEVMESEWQVSKHLYTGGGRSGIEITVPIDVMYPSTDPRDTASWHAAAASDWSRFAHRCLDTVITGSGIQARMCWDTPKFSDVASDPWFVMRMTVRALLDVEQ
jgi:hypothetical protein